LPQLLQEASAHHIPGLDLDNREMLWRYLLVRRINPLKVYLKPPQANQGYLGLDRENLAFSDDCLIIPQNLADLSYPQLLAEPALMGQVKGLPEINSTSPCWAA